MWSRTTILYIHLYILKSSHCGAGSLLLMVCSHLFGLDIYWLYGCVCNWSAANCSRSGSLVVCVGLIDCQAIFSVRCLRIASVYFSANEQTNFRLHTSIRKRSQKSHLGYLFRFPLLFFIALLLTLIKMGFLKNDLENFNCLFLKKV
jgi:hypothetical protein